MKQGKKNNKRERERERERESNTRKRVMNEEMQNQGEIGALPNDI